MNALEVKGLTKKYRDFTLSDISFSLPKGYIMGYVGQNGAGKTTTLCMIAHLLKGDAGVCSIDGLTYEKQPVQYREAIGYIGDKDGLVPDFTIGDVCSICRDFYPSFRADTFRAYVKKWKLPEKKKIKTFSRGMKVKLMFAEVLSRETKLLILDEATNGLDPVVRREILELLQDYISDGERSILFSTHILSDLEQIADYIFFIHNGKKVFFETKEELQEAYMLVKGGSGELRAPEKDCLIGVRESDVGFEALVRTDDAPCLPQGVLLEKPTVDQIVVHMIKDMEG